MKVRTDQGTIIDVDNGEGIIPITGTAASAVAGYGT